jgi:hypothetical protein
VKKNSFFRCLVVLGTKVESSVELKAAPCLGFLRLPMLNLRFCMLKSASCMLKLLDSPHL